MAEGTALRLVSRCSTVEEVVRAFRTLVRPDVPESLDVPVVGAAPAVGTVLRVVLTLANKVAILEGDAEVVMAGDRLGLRFVRLDPRSRALMAHMLLYRDREPAPLPRHLVPLGASAGTAATARVGAELAECTVEPLTASGPVPRATSDVTNTIRMPGLPPQRGETLRTARSELVMPAAPAAPVTPVRREQQKTLMGLAPLVRPTVASGPTPHGATEGRETGPTGPMRTPPSLPLIGMPIQVDSGPTTPVRSSGAPRVVDDAPTIPNDDIVTDVAVALTDPDSGLDDDDPVAEPPVHPGAVPVWPPPQTWPTSPGFGPPPAPAFAQPALPPVAPVATPRGYPAHPPAPAHAGAPPSYVPRAIAPDGELTELVQLGPPPRRRWAVVVATSVLVAGLAAAAVVIATRDRSSDDPAASAAPVPRSEARAAPAAPPTAVRPTAGGPPAPSDPPSSANPPVAVPAANDPALAATKPAAPTEPAAPVAPAAPTEPAAVVAAAPAPPTCTVAFASNPAGAEVVIAREVVGKTPLSLQRACTPFAAAFRRNRYQTLSRKVTPRAGTTSVSVRLERPSFKVKVTSRPVGATVKVAGVVVGKTPTTVTVPGYESVSIEASKPGYAPSSERVYASKGGGKLELKLRPRRR